MTLRRRIRNRKDSLGGSLPSRPQRTPIGRLGAYLLHICRLAGQSTQKQHHKQVDALTFCLKKAQNNISWTKTFNKL